MKNVKISDWEAMERICAILDQTNPGSPLATAVRRVFADFPAVADVEVSPADDLSVPDKALRSVRLPEATVRQWEAEASVKT